MRVASARVRPRRWPTRTATGVVTRWGRPAVMRAAVVDKAVAATIAAAGLMPATRAGAQIRAARRPEPTVASNRTTGVAVGPRRVTKARACVTTLGPAPADSIKMQTGVATQLARLPVPMAGRILQAASIATKTGVEMRLVQSRVARPSQPELGLTAMRTGVLPLRPSRLMTLQLRQRHDRDSAARVPATGALTRRLYVPKMLRSAARAAVLMPLTGAVAAARARHHVGRRLAIPAAVP